MYLTMNRQRWFYAITLLLVSSVLLAACVVPPPARGTNDVENAVLTESATLETVPEMLSAGVLHFGPNNELFVGDSKSGTIFAFMMSAGVLHFGPNNKLFVGD